MTPLLAAGGLSQTVTGGSLIAACAVALVAGVIGFASPCVLPLVPGYLSYVAGLAGSGLAGSGLAGSGLAGAALAGSGMATARATPATTGNPQPVDQASSGGAHSAVPPAGDLLTQSRRAPRPGATGVPQRRMIMGALLFVLGFTAVFVSIGALFGELASTTSVYKVGLERIFGVVTIGMGVVFLGGIPFLQRELKVHRLPRSGLAGAPLLGITFGLAWTPCQTPTLTAVTSLATQQATAWRGALLAVCYCLGLGVPFLLVAMGLGWATGAVALLRRHAGLVSRVGGALLILFGVMMLTGVWDSWMYRLNTLGSFVGFGI